MKNIALYRLIQSEYNQMEAEKLLVGVTVEIRQIKESLNDTYSRAAYLNQVQREYMESVAYISDILQKVMLE